MAYSLKVDAHSDLEKQALGQVIRNSRERKPDNTDDAVFFLEKMDMLWFGTQILAWVYMHVGYG